MSCTLNFCRSFFWFWIFGSQSYCFHSSLQVLSAMGSWYVFYFMFVVFFGSFYLINLVLAVVAVSYQQEVVSMQERVRILRIRYI